jgi:hypothetical protein|nr:MAG TPA: PORTAL PROTEIN, 15 PROTEIN, HEAD PROTEIN, TAILED BACTERIOPHAGE, SIPHOVIRIDAE.6A [Caudoviricetes sp.]
MDYREKATILVTEKISDNMGGYKETEIELKTIKCKVAPYTVKSIDSKGREISYSLNKLFTKEKILDDLDSDFSVLYGGKRYKKVSTADYGKCYMVIMERDD